MNGNVKQVSCGCETVEGKLLTLCGMHGNYTRQHVEAARAPRDGVDKDLQRQLVVAIAPIVVSRNDGPLNSSQATAEQVLSQVHEIMRRMD